MDEKRAIRAEVRRLETVFQGAGAVVIHADVLQPAETLLDLYGEDIRARAFVTHDALRGEYMLRPDFTVPVVQMHMADGAEPARYTYSGKVFRQQEGPVPRPNEYEQVGYEVFDRSDPAAADAEVFALISQALSGVQTRAVTGDIGILKAAVQGLQTSQRRKDALLRHIWRPARFRRLLDRFRGVAPLPAARAALLAQSDPLADMGTLKGVRSADEVAQRLAVLREDAAIAPISAEEFDLLLAILDLRGPSPKALAQVRQWARQMPALEQSAETMAARLDALERRGIETETLTFDASFGRSSMEYYDGFVFGFHRVDQQDLPPVATGGRYDALTQVLGRGKSIPAVGGVIRPGLLPGVGT